MTKYLTVIPAYGRDYKSAKAALADWNANKDFLALDHTGSGYINKEDAANYPDYSIMIRYNGNRSITRVKT